MKRKVYALYDGDTFVDLGTVAYLSKKYGISNQTIRYYASPIYRKRLIGKNLDNRRIVIILEDEGGEEI